MNTNNYFSQELQNSFIAKNNKNINDFELNEELMKSASKLTKVERLQEILTKMTEFLENSTVILSQKRIHREIKTIKALEQMCYKHTSKFFVGNRKSSKNVINDINNEESLRRPIEFYSSSSNNDEDKVGELVVPSGQEFKELLEFIENELDDKSLEEQCSSSSESADDSNNNNNINLSFYTIPINAKKRLSFQEPNSSLLADQLSQATKNLCLSPNPKNHYKEKNILNKENIKKHFLDLEYKIKVELKKQEIKEKEKAQFNLLNNKNSINNITNINLTRNSNINDFNAYRNADVNNNTNNFYEKLSKSNIEELKLISPGYKFSYDKIKSFFKEEEEEKNNKNKRSSHFNMRFPVDLQTKFEEDWIKEVSNEENEGIAKNSHENDNSKSSMNMNRKNIQEESSLVSELNDMCATKKDFSIQRKKRASFIKSSLFG